MLRGGVCERLLDSPVCMLLLSYEECGFIPLCICVCVWQLAVCVIDMAELFPTVMRMKADALISFSPFFSPLSSHALCNQNPQLSASHRAEDMRERGSGRGEIGKEGKELLSGGES